jgi:hypothetical protein
VVGIRPGLAFHRGRFGRSARSGLGFADRAWGPGVGGKRPVAGNARHEDESLCLLRADPYSIDPHTGIKIRETFAVVGEVKDKEDDERDVCYCVGSGLAEVFPKGLTRGVALLSFAFDVEGKPR